MRFFRRRRIDDIFHEAIRKQKYKFVFCAIALVEAAKYLIDEGNYDMMEVAHQCGYENEVTFRRAFMKQFK